MTKFRGRGVLFLILSSLVSVLWGGKLQRTPHGGIVDFRIVYLASRCLVEHRDPYSQSDYLRMFEAEGGEVPSDPVERERFQNAAMAVVYFPTALLFVAPFASFGWVTAQALWTILTVCLFTLSGCLIWSIASDSSPPISICLVALMLANAEVLYAYGNAAGVAVSLCVIAVWCFVKGRFDYVGALCLALSLAIKPHDSAAVWLFFLFAGGAYRKRALQALLIFCLLCVPSIVWVSSVSPHWMEEMRSNLTVVSAKGGTADPGPSGISNGTGGMIISLQTAASIFWDNPDVYNTATYIVCAPLLIAWLVTTLRIPISDTRLWLALAAMVPLSMLPVYHRPYDAKLLLLAVPACAWLWSVGGAQRWFALGTTSAAILLTSDIPVTIFAYLGKSFAKYPVGFSHQIMMVAATRPIPLVLLAMSAFYTWIYVRQPAAASF